MKCIDVSLFVTRHIVISVISSIFLNLQVCCNFFNILSFLETKIFFRVFCSNNFLCIAGILTIYVHNQNMYQQTWNNKSVFMGSWRTWFHLEETCGYVAHQVDTYFITLSTASVHVSAAKKKRVLTVLNIRADTNSVCVYDDFLDCEQVCIIISGARKYNCTRIRSLAVFIKYITYMSNKLN